MPDSRRTYTGTHVDVTYDVTRCRHAAECLRGLPSVFDAKRRPWILPDGADVVDVIDVVSRCPTGALRADPKDESVAPEAAPQVTRVEAVPGGLLLVHGDLEIRSERETRAALCSCGGTSNSPYCDGSGTCSGWPASA